MILRIILLMSLIGLFTATAGERNQKKKNTWKNILEKRDFEGLQYRYLAPKNNDKSKKYPLVLFLHGMGGRGTDNTKQLRSSLVHIVSDFVREEHPHFFIAPQTSAIWTNPNKKGKDLSLEECAKTITEKHRDAKTVKRIFYDNPQGELLKALALADKVIEENNIDTSRIYVIGHSMGGFGVWNALWNRPNFFAAAIPSAGILFPQYDRKKIAHIPIWFFHGDKDTVIDYDWGVNLYKQMKAVGANMKFTTLKGVGHGASVFAFGSEKLEAGTFTTQFSSKKCDMTADPLEWLFKQRK